MILRYNKCINVHFARAAVAAHPIAVSVHNANNSFVSAAATAAHPLPHIHPTADACIACLPAVFIPHALAFFEELNIELEGPVCMTVYVTLQFIIDFLKPKFWLYSAASIIHL
jgi:hypothetical protein